MANKGSRFLEIHFSVTLMKKLASGADAVMPRREDSPYWEEFWDKLETFIINAAEEKADKVIAAKGKRRGRA